MHQLKLKYLSVISRVRLQMKLLATLLRTQASKSAFSLKMVFERDYSGPEATPKRHFKIITKNKSSQIATKIIGYLVTKKNVTRGIAELKAFRAEKYWLKH